MTIMALYRLCCEALKPALLVALFSFSTVTQVKAQAFAWYPSSPLEPGSGVEINNPAAFRSAAVHYDSLTAADPAQGGVVQPKFEVNQLTSTRALETFSTFDFDLDANFLLFNGGTNVPWLTDYNFQGPTFVWGLRGYFDYGRYNLQNTSLLPDAKVAALDPKRFEDQYGDAYVSQIRKAALIAIIFSIDDASPNTLTELQKLISVGLTYNNIRGQSSGNLDAFLIQALTLGTVHMRIVTQGGPDVAGQSGIIGSSTDIASLDTVIAGYMNGVNEQNAVPVVYYTSPYTALGVTLPPPPPSTIQEKLEDLADRYYSAAQKQKKLEAIIGNFNAQYAYLDRALYNPYQNFRDQYADYISQVVAAAPKVRDDPDTATLPDPPAVTVPWPSPSMQVEYHLVTVNPSGANPGGHYTVVNASVHNAVVRDIVIANGQTPLYDLTQYQEDATYLMAHIEDNNFLFSGQFYGTHGVLPGTYKSDSYMMRWVLGGQSTGIAEHTAVALDSNGQVITSCTIRHGVDEALAAAPPNQLSE